jgi:hypothetical protein
VLRERPVSDCAHERMTPEVFDQTLGVSCPDCHLEAWCWAEKHVSEALWNLACKNDRDAKPCEQSRDDVCAMCGDPKEGDSP